jgi:hypothetical protein
MKGAKTRFFHQPRVPEKDQFTSPGVRAERKTADCGMAAIESSRFLFLLHDPAFRNTKISMVFDTVRPGPLIPNHLAVNGYLCLPPLLDGNLESGPSSPSPRRKLKE